MQCLVFRQYARIAQELYLSSLLLSLKQGIIFINGKVSSDTNEITLCTNSKINRIYLTTFALALATFNSRDSQISAGQHLACRLRSHCFCKKLHFFNLHVTQRLLSVIFYADNMCRASSVNEWIIYSVHLQFNQLRDIQKMVFWCF